MADTGKTADDKGLGCKKCKCPYYVQDPLNEGTCMNKVPYTGKPCGHKEADHR
jgi:hypothetical protein